MDGPNCSKLCQECMDRPYTGIINFMWQLRAPLGQVLIRAIVSVKIPVNGSAGFILGPQ